MREDDTRSKQERLDPLWPYQTEDVDSFLKNAHSVSVVRTTEFADISKQEPDSKLQLDIIVKIGGEVKILVWSNARNRWENQDGTENRSAIWRWAYLR